MPRRLFSRLQLVLFCLVAFHTLQIRAQTTGIFLCIGSASTNLQLANFQNCGKPSAAVIDSFSFGASLPVTSSGGTVTVGKTYVSQFTLQKLVDQTTVRWATSLYTNSSVATTLAVGVNVGGTNVTIRLKNPRVMALTHSSAGSSAPFESVSMSYDSITVYDNSTSPATVVTWSGT